MGKTLILVNSITYAMKGREILKRNGFRADILRLPKNKIRKGCGYGIHVPLRIDEAEKLLIKSNINVVSKITLDDDR